MITAGVDLGTRGVRLVVVESAPEGSRVVAAQRRDWWWEPDMKQPEYDQMAVEALTALRREHRLERCRVVSAVPRSQSFLKHVVLPARSQAEAERMMPFEVEKQIPLPGEEMVWDARSIHSGRLGPPDPSKQSEVLLAAARLETVDRHLTLLSRAGMEPEAVEITTLAAARSFRGRGAGLLLDIGEASSEITLVLDKVLLLRFSRSVMLGGRDLTEAVAHVTALPAKEAEQVKRERDHLHDRVRETVRGVCDRWQEELLYEIRETMGAVDLQIPQAQFERVYLCGGGSRLGGLARGLGEGLGIPVELHDPFAWMKDQGAAPADPEERALYAIAAGLAAPPDEAGSTGPVNLLPPDRVKARAARSRKSRAITLAAAACAAVVAGGAVLARGGYRARRDLKEVSARLEAVQPEARAVARVRARVEAARRHAAMEGSALDILRVVSREAPPNLWLTQFDYQRDGEVELRGRADTYGRVTDLIARLNTTGRFERVANRSSREETGEGVRGVVFEVVATLPGRPGEP